MEVSPCEMGDQDSCSPFLVVIPSPVNYSWGMYEIRMIRCYAAIAT